MRCRFASTVPIIALLLASCGAADPVAVPDNDPALSSALAGPILVDPDLVSENRANSAVALPSQDGSLPSVDAGPEAIAAARDEALELVGGPGKMRQAPEPRDGELPEIAPDCANRAQAQQTAQWAARMPAPFPVYPRGAVQDATGTDTRDCALRVVHFVTPVPLGEVIDFYFTRARSAGYSANHWVQAGNDVLTGKKGRASYVVSTRGLPSGNTEVELITNG